MTRQPRSTTATPTQRGTYPDQRRQLAEQLYDEWRGYYMLRECNLDLFGYAAPGCGYRDIRPLSRDEALTLKLTKWQAFGVIFPIDF
jgi:hypothetical protein